MMGRHIGAAFGLILLAGMGVGMSAIAQAGVKEGVDAWQAGDYPKAVAEWRDPAAKGDADAQFNLGQAYKLGRGVPKDEKMAQGWYIKAAQQDHEQAQANLGLMMFQSGDRAGAIPWIRKAADRGEPRAQYVLGTAMFNGDLVPRDWPRAYALMTRAAAGGLAQAGTSLQQMDQYISPADRAAGVSIAQQLASGSSISVATASPTANPATPSASTAPPSPPRAATTRPNARSAGSPKPPIVKSPPAPVTAAAPASRASSRGWRIQLGAFGSERKAQEAWAKASKRPGFAGLTPIYTSANALTRLQAGPFPGKAEANKACAEIAKAGQACFPIGP